MICRVMENAKMHKSTDSLTVEVEPGVSVTESGLKTPTGLSSERYALRRGLISEIQACFLSIGPSAAFAKLSSAIIRLTMGRHRGVCQQDHECIFSSDPDADRRVWPLPVRPLSSKKGVGGV
jgi:hypothetical protein